MSHWAPSPSHSGPQKANAVFDTISNSQEGIHVFTSLTADDSQPKIHSRSSRSFSLTVSSREIPSYGSKNKRDNINSKH